jgi:hypothetical protein
MAAAKDAVAARAGEGVARRLIEARCHNIAPYISVLIRTGACTYKILIAGAMPGDVRFSLLPTNYCTAAT